MRRDLHAMEQTRYDVLVIGGGINGTAVARDAALRGYRVALIEKEDFGYGTTARSTRLIHGGLRYLETFDFGLVREGLTEREILLQTAPHLVRPLAFLTPVYKTDRVGPLKVRAGMILYDLLSWGKSMPSHRFVSAGEAKRLEPGLNADGLRAAAIYYDGQVDYPERLCVENVMQAAQNGASIANHVTALAYTRAAGRVTGAQVRDELTRREFDIQASVVVNAVGPWVDGFHKNQLPNYRTHMRTTKGIHLVVPKLTEHAVVMLSQSDGRLFFAVPWEGYTLIGTTDTDYTGDMDAVRTEAEEIGYLARETRRVFPEADLDTIHLTMAGVRPLVRDHRAKSEGATSRKHEVHDHADEGMAGLISVLGGKITNQRRVGEEAADAIGRRLGRRRACTTAETPYYGGAIKGIDAFAADLTERWAGWARIGADGIRRLVDLYGTRAETILTRAALEPELASPLSEAHPDVLTAELAYAVEEEMAYRTTDFLLRRSGLGLHAGQAAALAESVAAWIGGRLGRDGAEVRRDVDAYLQVAATMAAREGLNPIGRAG